MGLLKRIDRIYANRSLEKRFIAKSLFWVCLVVTLVFISGTIINIGESDYFSASVEALFTVFLLISLIMLFKGKVEFVSLAVIYMALATGFLIGVISVEETLFSSFVTLVYLMPTLLCLGLVGSFRQTLVVGILIILSVAYSYLTNVIPAANLALIPLSETIKLILSPLLMGIVLVVFTAMIVYSTKNIIGKLSESESESKNHLNSVTSFFESLKETINVGEDLNLSAENSLKLTNLITGNLESMEKSIDSLQNQIVSTQQIHESIDRAGIVVKESSLTQSTAVEQSASAVEEMASSIIEMSKTAESRRELIEHLIQTEKDVSNQIKTGQKSFDLVKDSAGEMLNIVAVISDISERTNLLAMNAAIEAAHAGNSGKGFAVVAQEIRKLAAETGTNSQKIKGIIESSVKGIDNAVDLNSKVGNEFHAVSSQIKEIDMALSGIITGFSELAEGTNEITAVVENLSIINNSVQTSVNEVTDQLSKGRNNVDLILSATSQIKENMNEIFGDSKSIKTEAENIYKIGRDNVKQIRMLEENLQ